MAGEELPEDGYEGEYVVELGERIAAEGIDPDDREAVGLRGIELMMEGVRATLDRFGVDMDTWFSERGDLRPRRGRDGARQARRRRPHLPQRRRALAAHDDLRRRQRPGADPLRRRADLPDRRHRLPLGQAGARLRPADRRARRRPPRLRGAAAGRDRGARRRPRRLRGADHDPRPHRRGRPAGADVEAQRRLRLARRPDRRHRRRRRPLVHALAQPRDDRRHRPRAGPQPVERQPGLLRPVRARPDRQHPAQSRRGGRAGRRRARRRRREPPSSRARRR